MTVFAGCENAAPAAAQSATLLYVTPANIIMCDCAYCVANKYCRRN